MRINHKLYYLALSLCSMTGCEEYLDVNPEMGMTAEEVYSNYANFKQAVDRSANLVQNQMSCTHQKMICEVGTLSDEAQDLDLGYHALTVSINKGLWETATTHDFGFKVEETGERHNSQPAGEAIVAIRASNLCLENYHLLSVFPDESEYSEQELRNQLLGQSYFYRAYHYFQLIRRYGPMPDMRHSFSPDYDFDTHRPTYQQSSAWAVSDADSAIKYLPDTWRLPSDIGRPTATSAHALKAMMLLYAASPLMNPDLNPYGSNTKEYNIERAKEAVAASVKAIESASSSETRYKMYSWDEYSENFYSKVSEISDEAIFQPPLTKADAKKTWQNTGGGWYHIKFMGGPMQQTQQPTHNAIKWFETSDGYAIEDAPVESFDEHNPYANRDPRLKKFVFCHGDKLYIKNQDKLPQGRSEFFNVTQNGVHRTEFEKAGFCTGYLHRKFLWPGQNNCDNVHFHFRKWPIIRFAQLYLDFAEAANEAYGPTASVPGTDLTAAEAVNIVRRRVGMPDVRAEYLTDKETFKKRIYNERAVELFQEFHRWFDIRRWKIAKDLFAQANPIKGVMVRMENNEQIYEEVPLQGAERVFEDKHYWYPFPVADMDKLAVFEQNPGW